MGHGSEGVMYNTLGGHVTDVVTHPGASTVTMGHGLEGVMYNTLGGHAYVTDVVTHAGASTVTMGHGSEGVMYNTLCGQSVEFTIITKEQNGRKQTEGGDIFEVEICTEAGEIVFNDSSKDCGNGTYSSV
ncbi:hypothetical protein OS493_010376 [Desmophyllum pertusum]|uniref:Uncharacterized protein n=1 Tax=Desmophyllum pertusum TaxID=174260 RepID=A0A9X0A467_9CNID|nr:hypothetical protein OS493_010376 [Desmophyllum pertusum]